MSSAGKAAADFREIRFETARRVIRLATELDAGALFLLGDTFDGDRVGTGDIDETLAILEESPCPVCVLPGNHDWWHRGGVLASFARAAETVDHVRVLTESENPLVLPEISGTTFYPCPVLRHADVGDPTRWIPERVGADGIRVGLIHGGLDRAEWGGRVPERVAEVRDLDLALLGDWHKPVDGPDGRTFYAGSLEPGGFDEAHRGQVLIATVGEGKVAVERRPVGRLGWRRIELELVSEEMGGAGPGAVETVIEGVDGERADTAVRLHLSGALSPDEMDRLDGILDAGRGAGFAEFDVSADLTPLREPDLDAFEDEVLRSVARRIWEAEEEPEVRRRALSMLTGLAERVR
jgi:DNA repair exonuclease SbcCD nuclease subunit